MIISPAMLKIFEECPQKFKYIYLDKISLPQNKYYFEKGKRIHALANYLIKGFDVSKMEKILSDAEKSIWNYLKTTKYFGYKFIKSEYQLSAKFENNWIGGRLDALVKNKDDFYILDYKTGEIPKDWEYDYQTIVYLFCVKKLLKNYNSLNFVYLDLKKQQEKTVCLSENLLEKYEQKLSKILEKITNERYFKTKLLRNNKCDCDYYCLCKK